LRAGVVERLRSAGCVSADEEADELLAAAPSPEVLEGWVGRRGAGEPLAWITGRTVFCGRVLRVDPGVDPPRRQPVALAARAAARLPAGGRAADLCCGSGAIAVHLRAAVADAHVVAVDVDPAAVSCTRRNGVAACVGDVGGPLASDMFDVVTAVAPYVPTDRLAFLPRDVRAYEPIAALDGGDDGLAIVRRVIADAARILCHGGAVLLELGGDQLGPATDALHAAGFTGVEGWVDDEGDLRGVEATLSPSSTRAETASSVRPHR
jgi:release factor glutamine methyltransferase